MTKIVDFKYTQEDGRIDLGVPKEIIVKEGNYRDGGCALQFTTSEFSIGIKEKFELYLFAEDINRLTKAMWTSYLKTEPQRAKEDFEMICKLMNKETQNDGELLI